MNIKTILVPTDFSDSSNMALEYAKGLAQVFQASIHLLHVVQDPVGQPWGPETYGMSFPDLLPQMKDLARKGLEKALSGSERNAYNAEVVVAVGSPFNQILEHAKNTNVDLIVMGTHGRGALAHAILGSVTERVVRFAPCPVLTVRHK